MLDIGVWNFIWPIINILLLFILLRIFLFKPINKMIQERSEKIQNDFDEAEKAKTEAQELAQQNKDAVAAAKKEAQRILKEAREEAAAIKAEAALNAQEEAKQIIENANKTIETERRRSLQSAQSLITDLALSAAAKVIGESVDDDKNRRLVDKFLTEENKRLSHDDTTAEEGAQAND